jgi:phosphoribosylformimino-5-aminoimidazole carboxamide ribotide isomerase
MIVFPAIDLKGGQVVRLAEGDMARATVYGDDPAAQALAFAEAGAKHLHVVDLDGAFAGESRNREAVERIVEAFPGYVQLGGGIRTPQAVDARDGMVATEGWAAVSDVPVADMARRFEDAGVASLLFTDIGRDGLLKGCNVEATVDLARRTDLPVIASGGVKGLDDIRMLAIQASEGIEGVITGRALYDGRLDLAAALAMAERA